MSRFFFAYFLARYIYSHWPFTRSLARRNYLCAVISGAVTIAMGKRLKDTGKIMPAGVVAALSLGMSLFYCHHLVKAFTKSSAKKAP